MTDAPSLATLFVERLRARGAPALRATAALEAALVEAEATARQAWPGVDQPRESFVAFLADRMSLDLDDASAPVAVGAARSADLYLASACARGDARAMSAFQSRYAQAIEAAVPRRSDRSRLVDEVKQALFEKLFVAQEGAPPRIVDYAGRGDLGGWVRVAAARAALNLLRGEKRRAATSEAAASSPLPVEDPELARIESLHRDDFQQALRDAAADLTTRERNLLRQHHIDGLTMDQLASLYGLHRVTVIRAMQAAREHLSSGTRRRLRERLRIGQPELESLLRVVGSQLDLSIRRYLREDATG